MIRNPNPWEARSDEEFGNFTPVVGIVGVGRGGASQAVRIHRAQTDIELRARLGARARGSLLEEDSRSSEAEVRRPPTSEPGQRMEAAEAAWGGRCRT